MFTVHGNIPSDTLSDELMEHLSMHGAQPIVLEYIRFDRSRETMSIKATSGMKIVLSMGKNGIDIIRC